MTTTTTTTTNAGQPILEAAKRLLFDLARRYTRHHEDLKVTGRQMGSTIILNIQGHRDDHPKLVGTKGKHIWALQEIFAAAARRAGRPVRLTLLEATVGEKLPQLEFVPNPDWTPDATVDLLTQVLEATTHGGVEINPVDTGELTTFEIRPKFLGDPAARWFTKDLARALHLLFHAIGKAEGRQIHVDVIDPATGDPLLNGDAI